MDRYDPASHAPMYVAADVHGPEFPIAIKQQRELDNQRESNNLLHSKHAWFDRWQKQTLSLR